MVLPLLTRLTGMKALRSVPHRITSVIQFCDVSASADALVTKCQWTGRCRFLVDSALVNSPVKCINHQDRCKRSLGSYHHHHMCIASAPITNMDTGIGALQQSENINKLAPYGTDGRLLLNADVKVT